MTLDETYDFLMQIRRKEIIIRRKETQRDELRACLLPGAIRYDRDRVQSTPTDKMADVIVRVDELDREIEQLRREKASLVIEISDAIETLEDDYERSRPSGTRSQRLTSPKSRPRRRRSSAT